MHTLYIYMGLSENRVYSQWNSHLIGIMISKTIGFRGLAYFQTHPYNMVWYMVYNEVSLIHRIKRGMKYSRTVPWWLSHPYPSEKWWSESQLGLWQSPIPMTDPAGAGILMLTWLGFFWWDPWSTISLAAPLGSVIGYIKIITKSKKYQKK